MVKRIVKKLLYRERADSQSYIRYLRSKGVKIGEGTEFFAPRNTVIDETRPWLVEIGEYVQITDGVRILTHGYEWAVLKGKEGIVLGSAGKTVIGDNVFIGMNTTILKGVTISSNVVIGANSLVSKDCLKEGIYAGNPAKFIMTLKEYKEKRSRKQLEEAYEMGVAYYERYGHWPGKEIFREFFWLFENDISENKEFNRVMTLQGNYDESMKKLKKHKCEFGSFEDFMNYIQKRYRQTSD